MLLIVKKKHMKKIILLLLLLSSYLLQAQTPDLSKFQLEIKNINPISESSLYLVEAEHYQAYVYDSNTDELLSKGLSSYDLLIVEREDVWQVIDKTNYSAEDRIIKQIGTISKSEYDSLHIVYFSNIVGFNQKGLFKISTEKLSEPILIENASSIHLSKGGGSNFSSGYYPTEFDFDKVFIKYKEGSQLKYKDKEIIASNQYVIMDFDELSVVHDITFDKIDKLGRWGSISGIKDGERIVFSTNLDSIVDRGYNSSDLSGCDILFVIKNGGIGFEYYDNYSYSWITADVGDIIDMEIGHCEDIETKLVLKDGTVKYIDFWRGKIYEEEEWIRSYYEYDEEEMKKELKEYYKRQKQKQSN